MPSDARALSLRGVALLLVLFTVGCGSSDVADLEVFVKDKAERPGGLIEPIPTFTAYEAFAYSAAGM